MEKTYSFMLDPMRSALKARRDAEAKADAVHLRVVESKADWDRDCLLLRRIRRRSVSFQSMRRIAGNASLAHEMVRRGNALARSRKADEKKTMIIELHRQGVGPCPSARQVARRFGRCSAPYVVKIVRGYRNSLQPPLPISTVRGIR